MAAVLERFSKLTAKGQLTLPMDVRHILGVSMGSRVAFRIEDETVTLRRAESQAPNEDPCIESFLSFLAKDIEDHPESISALSPALLERIAGLIEGAEIDPNEAIEGEVAL
jgi:antitoxin PrlF